MLRKIFFTTVLLLTFSEIIQAQASFNLPANATPANINYAEYFIDTDPGIGNGISIPVTSSTDVTVNNYPVNLSSVNSGVHRIYVRTRDTKGAWSLTNAQTFFKLFTNAIIPSNSVASGITKVEYFIDTDPGFGKGISIPITSSNDITASNVAIDLSALSNGAHRIYFRSQNANGSWSETNVQTFNILLANVIIPPNPTAANITRFEYFFDVDPGFGNGTTITIPSTTDLSNYTFTADLTGLKNDTTHTLYIRTYDNWSLTNTRTFLIGTALPVTWISFNGNWENSSHNWVLLNWQTANEENNVQYEVQRSEDGIHFENVGNVDGNGTTTISHNYSFTDDLQNASQEVAASPVLYYRIRQTDVDGHFTYSVVISLRNPIMPRVEVSPNPNIGFFNLLLAKKPVEPVLLSVYDSKGTLIEKKKITDVETNISLSGNAKGIYWLRLQYKDGSNKTVSVELQ